MAVAEELQIIVDAKVTQAVKNLKKVDGQLGTTGKQTSKMAGLFKSLAGPLALGAVVAGSIQLGKAFSKAASDAEEIGSKYNTIFRDMTKEANAMADSFASDFGLASSTSKELLGNTADLLTGLGFTQEGAAELSDQVNRLAGDLASFSNFSGGTTGASEALTKALLGEAESAKALGIVINQNTKEYKDSVKYYTEVEGKTLLQAKAFTALKFATEQSGNAIGDVSRTWESHANVQRRLSESTKAFSEEMGKFVNEGATPLLVISDKIVRSLADWLGQVNDIKGVLNALRSDAETSDISLESLNDTLEELEGRRNQQLSRGGGVSEQLKEEISDLKNLINNYDSIHDRIDRNADAKAMYANITKVAGEEEQRLADIKLGSDTKLLELQFDALSAEAQQLQLLQEEIDKYSQLRSQGADVQELLNFLVAERNGLLKGEIELLDEVTSGYSDFAEINISNYDAMELRAMGYVATTKEGIEELKATWQDYAGSVMGFLGALDSYQDATASAELQRMEDAGASEEELDAKKKQIAIDDAKRTKALGLLNVAIGTAVAVVEAKLDPVLIGLAIATGAVQAAAISATPIPAFATGTSGFVANQPTPIMVGEGGQAEEVTVKPVGGSGGGGSERVYASVDGGEGFWMTIQRGVDDRKLRIPQGSIV